MMRLHGYWRSSAAYRVRIALALKGVAVETVAHDLRTGAQRAPDYRMLQPQGLVPALETDGATIVQSPAILEWLEERFPDPPLLPADREGRAAVRAMVALVACDIHPLHNLRVLNALRRDFGADEDAVRAWAAGWIAEGLGALERLIERDGDGFAFGSVPTLADCVLVPQLYAAERFGVAPDDYPRASAAGARLRALPGVGDAHPACQPDADR